MLTAGGPNEIMADMFHDFRSHSIFLASEDLREDPITEKDANQRMRKEESRSTRGHGRGDENQGFPWPSTH